MVDSVVNEIVGTEFKYVWVDEDDKIMSPVHASIGKAINFASDWHENYIRLRNRREEIEAAIEEEINSTWNERQLETVKKSMGKMTRTGKPPKDIKRVQIVTTIEEPEDLERRSGQMVVQSSMGSSLKRYGCHA